MVHQHFMLADNLTVLENIVLGAEQAARHRRRRRAGADRARSPTRYGLGVDPDVLVEDLGVGDRQRVEILKVLYRGAKILILDEPTAVLVPQEVDELFGNLRELKAEGLTVIFISHKLDEVLAVADDITVIRRGTTVGDGRARATSPRAQLAELMVGSRAAVARRPRESTVTDEVRARAATALDRASTTRGRDAARRRRRSTIHRGEVARHRRRRGQRPGRAGRGDHGHAQAADRARSARRQGHHRTGDTRERREAGIGYIPEDRHRHGLLLTRRCGRTGSSATRPGRPSCKGLWIDRAGARKDTERIVERVRRPHAGHRRHRAARCPAATSRS